MTADSRLNEAVTALVNEVAALRHRLDALESGPARQLAAEGAENESFEQIMPQRAEINPDPAVADWWSTRLAAWVRWLVHTYRLQETVPPCWAEHPQLVEELTASWLMWHDAWLTPSTPASPTHWHAALAAAVARIRSLWPVACTTAGHKSSFPPPWQRGNVRVADPRVSPRCARDCVARSLVAVRCRVRVRR